MLKTGSIHAIEYTKDSTGEKTTRMIIPTFVPLANIKSIDVTDLDSEERNALRDLLEDYTSYVTTETNKIFSFENWVDHTTNQEISPKWRAFKQSGIRQID